MIGVAILALLLPMDAKAVPVDLKGSPLVAGLNRFAFDSTRAACPPSQYPAISLGSIAPAIADVVP